MSLTSQPTCGGCRGCWVSSTQTPASFRRAPCAVRSGPTPIFLLQPRASFRCLSPSHLLPHTTTRTPLPSLPSHVSQLLYSPCLSPTPPFTDRRRFVALAGLCVQADCCCLSTHEKDLVVVASQSSLSFLSGRGRLHLWICLAGCSRRRL